MINNSKIIKIFLLSVFVILLSGCSGETLESEKVIPSSQYEANSLNEKEGVEFKNDNMESDNNNDKNDSISERDVINAEKVDVAPVKTIHTQEYTCNCSKTCSQMSSCAEAQYQLNVCGCSRRDGDGDGVACDADCQ